MFKKSKLVCLIAGIFLTLTPFITSSSYAYANEAYDQSLNETQKVVDSQLKKMEHMTVSEKADEVNRLLKQYEGMSLTLDTPLSRNVKPAQPSTEVKVVNGGINFFAYNKEGINKLANIFANLSFSEGFIGGSGGVAGLIAAALGLGSALTAGLAGILAALGSYAFTYFGAARDIMREHDKAEHKKAGVRISVTEVLDITNKGINAYG
ncbi:hypothetical protein [Enterococcus rivorum]|uniref:Glycine zipper family protein n=1 Tax=Enterococcus rivorum TaxID=762845 RepID=A0A1E5L0T5_9ENTE|nr:hypothetical protein [Enterococcus rivorum]MBP2098630.1 hypothetical protein [Enterococcus rivorum]OEH83728.1 hypothetical protein BCR26_07850 [Enterococcus rivorum]